MAEEKKEAKEQEKNKGTAEGEKNKKEKKEDKKTKGSLFGTIISSLKSIGKKKEAKEKEKKEGTAEGEKNKKEKKEDKKTKGRIISKITAPIGKLSENINLRIKKALASVFEAFIYGLMYINGAIINFLRLIHATTGGSLKTFSTKFSKKAGVISPKNIREYVDKTVIYSATERSSESIIGTTILYSIILAFLAFALGWYLKLSFLMHVMVVLGALLGTWFGSYVILGILADQRTESIEKNLPEVLQIMSQNMLAGMPPYNALILAARPEFGPIAKELEKVSHDTLSGKPLGEALSEMAERSPSTHLKRSVRLIIQGMKAGGNLPSVLQGISSDIREMQNLKKEMAANTASYAMFILFALIVGAPLLYAVSLTFVDIFGNIFGRLDLSFMKEMASSSMLKIHGLAITSETFFNYAIMSLAISGFFGAVLIGMIRTGDIRSGLKYAPILALVCVIIFVVIHMFLGGFLGGLLE